MIRLNPKKAKRVINMSVVEKNSITDKKSKKRNK